MRDNDIGSVATLAPASNLIVARLTPHAITALVVSVFASLIASLSLVYLALVLPSFDRLFPAFMASTPPVAAVRAPAPWFGPGPLSAQTDRRPALPMGFAGRPAGRPAVLQAVALASQNAETFARPAPIPASAVPAETVAVAVPAARPVGRPAEIVTIAASMSAPDRQADRPDILEDTLAALGLPASPRPAARPAQFIAARAAAMNAAPTAPQAVPPAQLASLAQPQGGIIDSGPGFSGSCSARLSRAIPRRPRSAAAGSDFIASLGNAAGGARDAAIVREATRGNVPNFLRHLVPVNFSGTLANGKQARITICVTPDYLALGSDRDYVRVPLGLRAAGQVAKAFNMMLPTTRMVDAIYAQAAVHLAPQPMPAGGQMVTTDYFLRHNATVQRQLAAAGASLGALVAGQKKDLVLTNRLASNPGKVAIYGWHRTNGRAIQPLTTVHGAAYADYSHGIRLVSRTAYLNGRATDLQELLMDSRYAGLINKEGAIGAPAIRLAAR